MLRIDGVSKRYPNGHLALEGIGLEVAPGEILGVVGGSGCGKSTLLRLIAGLEAPTAGEVLLNGRPVRGPRDEIGFVFQEPRLMPWLRIRDNVPLRHPPPGRRRSGRPARCRRWRASASPTSPGRGRANCPAAWPSARRWPARWSGGPRSCCSTSPSRRWTR
ncbi:aliphatic sulfonates import ATP-binding protein ssuB (fragment) (plasmid) [Azospirillum baldaniorum]|uniref:Aliphatic sulfonates import ATP-binding protein ssuB n=1 Tax=Azospirillum baldaniorum TaxID=1064539 RepID=A0A9P1JYC0_9PROT